MLSAVLAFIFSIPGTAAAHSPQEVKLSYDASTRTLQADVTHASFSAGHYVKSLEVRKNGKVVAVQDYTGQSAETFSSSVKVDAAPGDVLEVKASCSRFGSRTASLKVGPAPAK